MVKRTYIAGFPRFHTKCAPQRAPQIHRSFITGGPLPAQCANCVKCDDRDTDNCQYKVGLGGRDDRPITTLGWGVSLRAGKPYSSPDNKQVSENKVGALGTL